jgi:predicted peroxiredoxin
MTEKHSDNPDFPNKVLIMLRHPQQLGNAEEALRMAKHMRKIRNLPTTLALWGPEGVLMGQKKSFLEYSDRINELVQLGVNIVVCQLGMERMGLKTTELKDGLHAVPAERIPELLLLHYKDLIIYF